MTRLIARIGLVLGVVAGLGAVVAAPAYALPTDLSVSASGGVTLKVGGGTQQVDFRVRNEGPRADGVSFTVQVPLGGDGVSISHGSDGCSVDGNSLNCQDLDFRNNESRSFFVKLSPPKSGGPGPGESRDGEGKAEVRFEEDLNGDNNTAGFKVTLKGPDKPKAVTGVSGVVKDEASQKPVANAKVSLTDSAGKEHTTATGTDGGFKLASTQDQPIAVGPLKFTITKSGYETKELTKTGNDGQNVRVETTLVPKAAASGSASPPATEEPGDTGAPTEATGGEEGGSGINWLAWLLYALAAALVLGGIGAIVWLFRRRDDEDEDYDPDAAGPGPQGAPPGYQPDPYGAQTTVMVGPQPTTVLGADQPTSMMNRAGIDQPTSMINRPGVDQATSMIDRSGMDHTQAHPGPLADDGGDDVYPGGRENYAPGSGYGPSSGYGRPEPDPYGADPGYGGQAGGHQAGDYDTGRSGGGRHSAEPPAGGYGGADPGYGADPGHGGDRGYGGGDPGYGDPGRGYGAPGYGEPAGPDRSGGYGEPGRSAGHRYDDQPPRRGGGRHSAGDDDRRLDWFED
ncbi:MAG: carboxypeptidase-like regulatory domain-containing protein [Micromonosporaceae bacterium]